MFTFALIRFFHSLFFHLVFVFFLYLVFYFSCYCSFRFSKMVIPAFPLQFYNSRCFVAMFLYTLDIILFLFLFTISSYIDHCLYSHIPADGVIFWLISFFPAGRKPSFRLCLYLSSAYVSPSSLPRCKLNRKYGTQNQRLGLGILLYASDPSNPKSLRVLRYARVSWNPATTTQKRIQETNETSFQKNVATYTANSGLDK